MVPIDPSSVAQAYGGDSSKNLMITRPGLLACGWGGIVTLCVV